MAELAAGLQAENVVNMKVLAGFTRYIEMCCGKVLIAADGKRGARRWGVETC